MPSGRTHDRITLILLPPIAGASFLVSGSGKLTLLLLASYLFSGFLFGPDLDIHSVQYKRWGYLRWLWLPYRSMIRHRGWLSHGLLIGTIFRLFYFGSFLLLAAIVIIWPQQAIALWQQYPRVAIAIFLGLELGAMSHSCSDWIGSAYKRSRKVTRKPVKKKKR
ncbi:MAG: metal-binding protein [Microcystis aeruginosa Ma_AC_P_19900807_S299]|nr:MAG: metal-binding protein [Microcystis aeruginosa Ma_AC_P_19900807_S299]